MVSVPPRPPRGMPWPSRASRADHLPDIGGYRRDLGRRGGAGGACREEGALASLVDPGVHIPAATSAIHGIFDADVRGAPRFSEIGPALSALAAGAVIVAHNAPFDLGFLSAELARAGLPQSGNESADTRLLARSAFPGLPSFRLVELARHFGLEKGRSHRALDDALTCMALLLRCAGRLAAGPPGQD